MQSPVAQDLISGAFESEREKTIQKLVNALYAKKNFDALIGQIQLLDELGEKINKSEVLSTLFNGMNLFYCMKYSSSYVPADFFAAAEKLLKQFKVVPPLCQTMGALHTERTLWIP